jgi:hypothetical protein
MITAFQPMKPVTFERPEFNMNTKASRLPAGARLRRIVAVVLLAMGCVATSSTLLAATASQPDRMTYQGFLADGNDVPLAPNGPLNYSVVFRIWTEDIGGTLKWSEKQTVTVDKGRFSVILGEGAQNASEPRDPLNTVFTGADASDRYLEMTVTIGTDTLTIAPRLRFVSSPYAMLARRATALVSPDGTSLVTAGNGALTVNGSISATSISGAASGLTGLNASRITSGALSDSRLSGNIVKLVGSPRRVGIGGTNFGGSFLPGAILHVDAPQNWRAFRVDMDGEVQLTVSPFRRVGVGISDPGAKLHVDAATGTPLRVDIDGNAKLTVAPNGGMTVGKFDDSPPQNGLIVAGSSVFEGSADFKGSSQFRSRSEFNGECEFKKESVFRSSLHIGPRDLSVAIPAPLRARLEVDAAIEYPTRIMNGGWVTTNGSSENTTFNFVSRMSIYASDSIWTEDKLVATSDARIKAIDGRSDSAADLQTLLGIEITDYHYKDRIGRGDAPHKKVIAQQVEKVFPQAVGQQTNTVPDIYRSATIQDGWVALQTDLKKGERVRLITKETEGIYEVLAAEADRFRTALRIKGDRVFVFGREVNDFRTVEYDALSMLNVSATQELANRLRQSEARVVELEREMAELRKLVTGLARANTVKQPDGIRLAGTIDANPSR